MGSRRIAPATRIAVGVLLSGAVLGSLATALMAAMHVRLNTSPSLPLGFYRDAPGPVTRGAMVVACLPAAAGRLAKARGYLGPGTCPGSVSHVGKIVLAMPGDTVTFTASGMTVNGRHAPHSAPRGRDYAGRWLPHHSFGTVVVRAGTVVLYAPHDRSLDARYVGPIATSLVRTVVRPLWTADEPQP